MNKLLSKIFSFIKKVYGKLVDETKKYIPIAINVVEVVKKVMDSPVDDVALAIAEQLIPAIPKAQVDIVKSKVEEYLPKLLLELNLVNDIANITDPNEQLKTILNTLKLSSDDVKAEKYHTLASKLLVILSDGKVTWGEAVVFVEWYYQTYIK